MSILGRILLMLLIGLAPGCACNGSMAGDRCETPADCDPPLLCSNETAPEGTLGICVLPEAVPDAAVPEPDAEVTIDAEVTMDASPTQDASP